jgi:hypothetical protein
LTHECEAWSHERGCWSWAGEIKGELVKVLCDMVARHQAARAAVTEEVVDAFMAVRPMALVASGKA